VRPGSTGFSLCGFDFRTRGKAHRLKSALPKSASRRNAMQRVNFANGNRYRSRVCEKFGLEFWQRKNVDGRLCVVNNAGTMKTTVSGKRLNGRLAVLGAGKIGGILLRAFLQQKLVQPKRVHATVRHAEKARALAEQLGIEASTDNRAAVRGADIVLLAVKPQAVREVLEEIKPEMKPGKLIVSVVASVPTQLMEKYLGLDAPVVRAMPNTPCAIGCGMTGLARGIHAGKEHLEIAQAMFEAVGRVVVVDEKQIDAVTGLSASGTAFIYIILESLAEGGVKVGLPRDISTLLAAQTMMGAARMVLDTGDHPALLKDAVTTPADSTMDGILELEDGKVRVTLIKAVMKATQRAKELILES
jgi:pyrroline-5-carboxylate reductase